MAHTQSNKNLNNHPLPTRSI